MSRAEPLPSPPQSRPPRGLRRGACVAFLGLDGSGKSTLLARLLAALEAADVRAEARHMHPGFLPPLSRLALKKEAPGPVTQPHARRPSGALVSFVRLAYYWADYVLGYAVVVLPRLRKRRSVFLFDRYSYDYLVDPRRCRIRLPGWVVRAFVNSTPAPDLIFVLEATPAVLYRRKPELPLEVLEAQARRLNALAGGLKGVRRVNTALSIEQCHREILQALEEAFPGMGPFAATGGQRQGREAGAALETPMAREGGAPP